MSASSGAEKAAQQVHELLANPYVRRVAEDPAIRDNARVAYESAREAIDRAKKSDNLVNALFDDRRLQADLRTLGESVATARGRLIQPPKRKRRLGRAILLLGVGAVLAVALSEGLRNKVLDLLFGAEEEFDYVSTTAPPAPATASNGAAAPEPAAAAPAPAEAPEPEAESEGETKAGKDA